MKNIAQTENCKKTQLQAARGLGYLAAQVVHLKIKQVLKTVKEIRKSVGVPTLFLFLQLYYSLLKHTMSIRTTDKFKTTSLIEIIQRKIMPYTI